MRSTTLAAPLLRALHAAILERDAWPLLRAELPGVEEDFYALARDAHLDAFGSIAEAEAAQADAFLAIQAPDNTRALADVDPERMARVRALARAADASCDDAEALVRDAVADAGRRAAGGHGRRRVRRVRARRAVPRPRRPGGARGASWARSRRG